MNKKSFSSANALMVRRHFLASAVATGMGAVCATDVLAGMNIPGGQQACGELTAADPLYLYSSLVSQLQPAAIMAARNRENVARKSLSQKLKELWTLSDELKGKISRQATIHSSVDRVSTLAKIGRINARAIGATRRSKSPELSHADLATQKVITQEIVKTSLDLSQQGQKTLNADEWDLLQKMLALIDDIKTTHQPAVVAAEQKFDQFMKDVNNKIIEIQTVLMDASRDIVIGQKALAQSKIKFALDELRKLPADPSGTDRDTESLTRDELVSMIEPILILVGGGTQRAPRVSHHSSSMAQTPLALITAEEIFLPNTVVQTSTVKAVVQRFFRSGNWWQVVGVTAACLPLWASYNQTQQRLSLIRSAISAVPRGRGTDLDGAAQALNALTS